VYALGECWGYSAKVALWCVKCAPHYYPLAFLIFCRSVVCSIPSPWFFQYASGGGGFQRPKYWKYSPNSRPCDKSAPSFLSPLLFLVCVFVIFPSYRDSFRRSARKHTKNSSETTVPWELENPCEKLSMFVQHLLLPLQVFPKNKVKVMDNSLYYR
jgi:hypothetical protein